MNKSTIVLVGCVVGAGGLFYLHTSASASRPTTAEEPAATATTELAHSEKTPKPAASPSSSPTVPGSTATPTPPKLTLAQAKNLPRPATTSNSGGGTAAFGGYNGQAAPTEPPIGPVEPPPSATEPVPSATTTPGAPSEVPSTPTPTPWSPPATPTPNPWPIATPPTLPPYPDGGLSPKAPSE